MSLKEKIIMVTEKIKNTYGCYRQMKVDSVLDGWEKFQENVARYSTKTCEKKNMFPDIFSYLSIPISFTHYIL